MDFLILVFVLVLLLVWAWFHFFTKRMPIPGPYRLPIIGNIHQLGSNPHQSLAHLSKTYGPLMSLQLGSTHAVVVSSPHLAKQVLQLHDKAFSIRTIPAACEVFDFHLKSLGFLPVGSAFTRLRKIYKEHMFSTQRLDESWGLRLEKLRDLQEYVNECSIRVRPVNIGHAAFVTNLNILTTLLFSVDFTTFDSDGSEEFRESVEAVTEVIGAPNIADSFPLLRLVDPQKIMRKAEFYIGKLLNRFEDIMNERLKIRGSTSMDSPKRSSDMLERLLNLVERREDDLNISDIKFIFMDLLLGGSDTTTTTVEWGMQELVLNPAKMANVRNELRSVIGPDKQVTEPDIQRLPYLQAVVKEVLRLHPPVPLSIPRKAEREVEINGYTIPKNTQMLVNVWAIGRDSSVWPNPTSFEPERFLNTKIDYKGQDFSFIPFGSGRRACPGLPLADRMLPLMLASFIQNFDWKLEAGVKVDTTEKFGLAVHKAVPIMATPIKVGI